MALWVTGGLWGQNHVNSWRSGHISYKSGWSNGMVVGTSFPTMKVTLILRRMNFVANLTALIFNIGYWCLLILHKRTMWFLLKVTNSQIYIKLNDETILFISRMINVPNFNCSFRLNFWKVIKGNPAISGNTSSTIKPRRNTECVDTDK